METQEQEQLRRGRKGLSLRNVNIITGLLTVLISIALMGSSWVVSASYDNMRRVTEKYNDWQTSSYELQIASDYLTEQVRSFVFTGEKNYMDKYFEEAKVSRRREKALEALESNHEGNEAYLRLKEAMNESVELMKTEYSAMKLTALAYGLNLSALPEEVKNARIPDLSDQLDPEELRFEAEKLVMDRHYHDIKNDISENMSECLSDLQSEMEMQQK